MTEAAEQEQKKPAVTSKLPLIIGTCLACLGGGVGFYITWSGMVLDDGLGSDLRQRTEKRPIESVSETFYIDMEPLTVSLRAPSESKYLRFRASLEVQSGQLEAVTKLLPRVTDMLNGYLRAIEPSDLEDASALTRLRGQMLRRVQIITGLGNVKDLLIMEFVLN
jgi:flagellar FliL protein